MKRATYWYEIPLAFAVLHGLNVWLAPESVPFLHFAIHPYWLPIVLFALHYGLRGGALAGAIAAGLYGALIWWSDDRYLFEDADFLFLPGLFLCMGVAIGAAVENYRRRLAAAATHALALLQDITTLREEAVTQATIRRGLEKQIVTRMATLITLYEGARQLENDDPHAVQAAIVTFIAHTLDAPAVALYVRNADMWELRLQHGDIEPHANPHRAAIRVGTGIVGLAGARGRVVTVRDVLKDPDAQIAAQASTSDCLFAGCLMHADTGEIYGVIAVQRLDFLLFNSSTVNLFAFLLDWAARALTRAQHVQVLRAADIVDPTYQVYSYRYAKTRGTQEFARSKTYALPFGVALIAVPGLSTWADTAQRHWLQILARLLSHQVRDIDILARGNAPDLPFLILFMTASAAQCAEYCANILHTLTQLGQDAGTPFPAVHCGLSNYTPQHTSFDEMMKEAGTNVFRPSSQ